MRVRIPAQGGKRVNETFTRDGWETQMVCGELVVKVVRPVVRNATDGLQLLAVRVFEIFHSRHRKALFKIVEAERMLPERFATTCCTSSGNATPPSDTSTRSRGFRVFRSSDRSSFSKVLMTTIQIKKVMVAPSETDGTHPDGS